MQTPHERAVSNAGRTTDRLGKLFDRLGHADSRRGVFRAYRTALAALAADMSLPAFDEVTASLRRSVELEAGELLAVALQDGIESGGRDASFYGFTVDSAYDMSVPADALAAILATVDTQIAGARALLLLGANDDAQIIGSDERAGILTPAPATVEAARWIVLIASTAADIVTRRGIARETAPPFLRDEAARAVNATAPALFNGRYEGYDFAQFGIGAKVRDLFSEWGRQAVAVIDERTTDCCLRVHGQWQAMGDDFTLTGTPRFADTQPRPPFHKWCRTATALVQRQYAADDLTAQMREAARAELTARTLKPRRRVITPANAFSRRA